MTRIGVSLFFLVTLFLGPQEVLAKNLFFINLAVPEIPAAPRVDAPAFFLRSVVDARDFGGPGSDVAAPSWGVDDPSLQTEGDKHKAVGRAFVTRKKSEGNVLILRGDVETIVQQIVTNALAGLGYPVVETGEALGSDTILVDIEIQNFWGFFEATFIGGSITANIETLITMTKPDKIEKRNIQVSASKSLRYPNKAANWEIIFDMALNDYAQAVMTQMKQ